MKHQILHLGFRFYHKATLTALYFRGGFSYLRLGQIFIHFTADIRNILEILDTASNIFHDQ